MGQFMWDLDLYLDVQLNVSLTFIHSRYRFAVPRLQANQGTPSYMYYIK